MQSKEAASNDSRSDWLRLLATYDIAAIDAEMREQPSAKQTKPA